MFNRINANRKTASCYAITDPAKGSPFAGYGNTTTFSCNAFGTKVTRDLAAVDLDAWEAQLRGESASLNGQDVLAMIGARGCISHDAVNDIYTVSIAWQGLTETAAPTNTCATGLYGSETMRRVVSTTLRIADLN
jgi:type IV pilus assembly protein PilV